MIDTHIVHHVVPAVMVKTVKLIAVILHVNVHSYVIILGHVVVNDLKNIKRRM